MLVVVLLQQSRLRSGDEGDRGWWKRNQIPSSGALLRLRQFKIKHPPPFNIFRYWIFPLLPFRSRPLPYTLSFHSSVCVFFIFFKIPTAPRRTRARAHSHLSTHAHTHTCTRAYVHCTCVAADSCLSCAQSLAKISICRRASDINFKKNEN